MSAFRRMWLCAVLVLAVAGTCTDVFGAPRANYVIVISVDGMGSEYVKPLLTNGCPNELTTFKRFQAEGAGTLNTRDDADFAVTLPNHVTMVTGRGAVGVSGHGWTNNDWPDTVPPYVATLELKNGAYVSSGFDVAHDNGLRTGIWSGKDKFDLFQQSYATNTGALDITGPDNGRDKIDYDEVVNAVAAETLTTDFTNQMSTLPFNFAFFHYQDPDATGHSYGWSTNPASNFAATLKDVDTQIGVIMQMVTNSPVLKDKTAIILTADHGGHDNTHGDTNNPLDYTIPFYVWGSGVQAGADLYALNSTSRTAPGPTENPKYAGGQPVRNGDAVNLALRLLGLCSVPGSTINSNQDLMVSVPGTIISETYSGTDLLSLHTDAGPHSWGWSGGMIDNGGVTYKLWGDNGVPVMLDGAFNDNKWFYAGYLGENDPASEAQMDANDPGTVSPGRWVWWTAHFDHPTVISHFIIRNADWGTSRTPDQFQLRGSNDGINWTVIYRYSNNTIAGGFSPWTTVANDGYGVIPADNSYMNNTAVRFDGAGVDFNTPAAYTQIRLEVFSATRNGDAVGITEWQLAGTTPPFAAMDVTGAADTSIPDGNSDYTIPGTHFGTVAVGSSATNTFKIHNTGNGNLVLNGAPLVFVDGDFSVTNWPAITVTNGGTTTFSITFRPTVPAGNKTTMLAITNNDVRVNPYNFGLKGTATTNSLPPEIDVTGPLGNSIANGNSNYTGDGTDFGTNTVGSSRTNTFTIHNAGTGSLLLSGTPMVLIGGADAAQFIVTNQPSSPVATSGTTIFKVVFTPSGFSGNRTATLSIDNNDSNANPYTFNMRGWASGFSTGRVITVPYSGPDLLSLHTDAGPHPGSDSGGMTDSGGVTYKVWGDNGVGVMINGTFNDDKWFYAANLSDNNPASTAQMNANDPGAVGSGEWVWWTAHFSTPVVINHFVYRNADAANDRTPDQFQLRGSNDGINWTVIYRLDNNAGITPWGQPGDIPSATAVRFDGGGDDFATPAAYSQIRLEVFSATQNGNTVGITEWQLAGTAQPDINNEPSATNITLSSAFINGTLLSSFGSPAQVWAYWGLNDGVTNVLHWANTNYFGTNTLPFPVTNSLLVTLPPVPNQTYYYRYCASNDVGLGWATSSATFKIEGGSVIIVR